MSVPAPDGPFCLFHALSRRWPASADLPRAARGRRRRNFCSTATRWRRGSPSFSSAKRVTPPTTGCSRGPAMKPARNFIPRAIRDLATGHDLADTCPEVAGVGCLDRPIRRRFTTSSLMRMHRPQSVYRHRLGTACERRRADVSEPTTRRYLRCAVELQSGRFARSRVHDHETSECWLIDLVDDAAARAVVASRARRERFTYSPEHHPAFGERRRAVHPHQCRRRGGFQDRHGRRLPRRAGTHWRDLVPHRPGVFILAIVDACRLAGPARARRWPAAHRRARSCRAARSTPLLSPRKPIRWQSMPATNSKPTCCASPIPR